MAGEVAQHKAQLQHLAETDPDFYAFLKENDQELLDFMNEKSDSESEEDEEEEEDKVMASEYAESARKAVQIPVLTTRLLQKLETAAFDALNFKALRQMLHAFRAACFMGTDDEIAIAKRKRLSRGKNSKEPTPEEPKPQKLKCVGLSEAQLQRILILFSVFV